MIDVLFVALLAALFALTAGFVVICDRMLGSDEEAIGTAPRGSAHEQQVAA